jgi:ubiquinone/menaquinone biosynthesis C-methylase UbiE
MKDPYKRIAPWYNRIFEPLNSGLRTIGIKMFPPDAGMQVLDIGCGTGIHLSLYQKRDCKVYGIDTSPAMMQIARTTLGEKADLHLGDASQMPYQDDQFDLVISATVLHEMPEVVRFAVLSEAKRTLKEQGRMLLIDFHPGPYKPLKGWFYKSIITAAEVGAGREHFRNYRHFIRNGGISPLIEQYDLLIDQKKIVSGGNIALYLLKKK